jgi:hypothetical protein
MKTARFLLAALPLLFLAAAASRHQAFGPLKFGMPAAPAAQALFGFTHNKMVNTAEIRKGFVSNGTIRIGRNTSADSANQVFVTFKAEPFVNQVSASTKWGRAESFNTYVKQAWENLQDIGDSKFKRIGEKGVFPPIENINPANKEVVTDTWEMEGIRIELLVTYSDPATQPGATAISGPPSYNAILRATEIAPPAQ